MCDPADNQPDQTAVLRFCEAVLRERSDAGDRAWIWKIKRKIAVYCRRNLERSAPAGKMSSRPLSETEAEEVLAAHPLLNDEAHASPGLRPQSQWLERLQRRVRDYTGRLQQSRQR